MEKNIGHPPPHTARVLREYRTRATTERCAKFFRRLFPNAERTIFYAYYFYRTHHRGHRTDIHEHEVYVFQYYTRIVHAAAVATDKRR